MGNPPEIIQSTIDERREYIKKRYPCISDCDMCRLCTVFRGKDPELAYRDYIEGESINDRVRKSTGRIPV